MVRSFLTVGSLNGVSRLLGYVRDVLVAATLGSSGTADVFYAAFRFTTLFRSLIGEGSLNGAFVPLFGRRLADKGRAEALLFAESTHAFMATVSAVIVVALIIAMPWIIIILTPGFRSDSMKLAAATVTMQMAMPYIFFLTIGAVRTAMLNSVRLFLLAGLSALAPNLILIVSILTILPGSTVQPEILACSLSAGGACQFLILVIGCRRAALSVSFRWPALDQNVRQLLRLMGPVLGSGFVLQANILVGMIVGSYFQGGVTYLYYAERIWQLPVGIVVSAVSAVFLPELVRNIRSGLEKEAIALHGKLLSAILIFAAPGSVLLSLLAEPLAALLFQRGAFTESDAQQTANLLKVVAFAIPAIVGVRVFLPGFIAREDTVTPMKIAFFTLIINAGLAALLASWVGLISVPLASTVAAWVNCLASGYILHRKGYFFVSPALLKCLANTTAATCAMALVVLFGQAIVGSLGVSGDMRTRGASLALWGIVGTLTYGGTTALLGGENAKILTRLLQMRRRGRRSD